VKSEISQVRNFAWHRSKCRSQRKGLCKIQSKLLRDILKFL